MSTAAEFLSKIVGILEDGALLVEIAAKTLAESLSSVLGSAIGHYFKTG